MDELQGGEKNPQIVYKWTVTHFDRKKRKKITATYFK